MTGKMYGHRRRWMGAGLVLGLLAVAAEGPADVADLWAAAPGYAVEVDVTGLDMPSAIAFVPEPGTAPDDVLYFVTELRGGIQAVTNARDVVEFAQVDTIIPDDDLPGLTGETGMAGICLDPVDGLVFVTYTQRDDLGRILNRVARFDTGSPTFSTSPTRATDLSEPFIPFPGALSHQIGGCVVDDDALYVSVGDGARPSAAVDPDRLLGKIVGMTLDGRPHPDNDVAGETPASAYVYAYGFRNPFGLMMDEDSLYAAENGVGADRTVRIRAGQDHGWRGSDASITLFADYVWTRAVSPVHIDVIDRPFGDGQFDEHLVVAIAGNEDAVGAVVALPFASAAAGQPRSVFGRPVPMVEYLGDREIVTGVGFGPDGVYFTPILGSDGAGSVLKIVADPDKAYASILGESSDAEALVNKYGCVACHAIGERDGGSVGPVLTNTNLNIRLQERFSSEDYPNRLRELNEVEDEPWRRTRQWRTALLEAETTRERLQLYIEAQIQEPRFDDPAAQMPQLNVTPEEAVLLRNYVLGREPSGEANGGGGGDGRLQELIKLATSRRTLAAGSGGAILGSFLTVLIGRRRRRVVTSAGINPTSSGGAESE